MFLKQSKLNYLNKWPSFFSWPCRGKCHLSVEEKNHRIQWQKLELVIPQRTFMTAFILSCKNFAYLKQYFLSWWFQRFWMPINKPSFVYGLFKWNNILKNMQVWLCICMYMRVWEYMCTFVHMDVCVCVCVCVCVYASAYVCSGCPHGVMVSDVLWNRSKRVRTPVALLRSLSDK